jgi:hypothetical protein
MRLRGRVMLTVAGGAVVHRQPMLVAGGDAGAERSEARR